MKKNILLLLAVVLIFSCAAIALADILPPAPTLTLQVTVASAIGPNVTYTATLRNNAGSTAVPVITFYCNSAVVGTAPVNSLGVATLKLTQSTGQYQAISAWLNTTNPIISNSVTYKVP